MTLYNEELEQVTKQVLDGIDFVQHGFRHPPDILFYDQDVATEEGVKKVAARIVQRPNVIINVGEPSAIPDTLDSTARVNKDTVPVEILVAVSELRDMREQMKKARLMSWIIRKNLQGVTFHGDVFPDAAFVFVAMQHLGSTKGMTMFSVIFRVEGHIDLDVV